MNVNQCKPNDMDCLQKEKMLPVHTFVDKIARKMTIRGCRVSFSEHTDALNSIHALGGVNGIQEVEDIKTILRSSLSKSDHCDSIFEKSWNELLLPQQAARSQLGGSGLELPPGMLPIVEKHIANMINKSGDIEGMIVDEREMEELLKQGRIEAGQGQGQGQGQPGQGQGQARGQGGMPSQGQGGMPGQGGGPGSAQSIDELMAKCKQAMGGGGSGQAIGVCLGEINKAIKDMINSNFDSRKLSKIKNTGNDVDEMINKISREINGATEISNEDAAKLKKFVNDLRKFKDALKKSIDAEIPKMDISPEFGDSETEKKFVDEFMRGTIGAYGHPEFIGVVTESGYFKSKVREGLKSLHTRKGHRERVREKGKIMAAQHTIKQGMRKGMLLDTFYKSKPPKQKEDIVWLVDTSGSMGTSLAFIQPIIDGVDSMGLKQKAFLGTEEGVEIRPHEKFKEVMEKMNTGGTQLSKAYDDIKPSVGTFKDKTLIIYTDMEDADEKEFEKRLDEVVSEGGKVLILNNEKHNQWDKKYVEAVAGREPIVEFEKVDNFDRMLEVLREAAPIIKK